MSGYRLGVDLGTTYSAAAVAGPGGAAPAMLGLGNRALEVPSVVYLPPEGEPLVGEPAQRRGQADPTRVVAEFKRRLGDSVPILVGGVPYSPQALTATLLTWVVRQSTERMGGPPERVVLAHPANWGPYKRELLAQVIELADVGDVGLVCEPEAAAIRYASRSTLPAGSRIAVYDLGGGTFDTCLLERTEDGFVMLGEPVGIEHLGGIDFDDAVFRHVLEVLAARTGTDLATLLSDPVLSDPAGSAALARLRRDCVEAKEALSADVATVVPVTIPGWPTLPAGTTLPSAATTVRLTRSEVEDLIRPPLGETLAAVRRSLRSAGLEAGDLASIVLVGGGSRIPLVSQLLTQEFGVPLALDTHPKHDVALGAALAAGRPPRRSVPSTPSTSTPSTSFPSTPSTPSTWAGSSRVSAPEDDGELRPGVPFAVERNRSAPRRRVVPPPPPPPPVREAGRVVPTRPAVPLLADPDPTPFPVEPGPFVAVPLPPVRPGVPRRVRATPRRHRGTAAVAGAAAGVVAGTVAILLAISTLGDDGSRYAGFSSVAATSPAVEPPPGIPGLPSSEPLGDRQVVVPMRDDDNWDIYLADTRRRSPVERLTRGPGFDSFPALSPDRRTIVYVRRAADGTRSLRVMAADGTGDRALFRRTPRACSRAAMRPAWDPVDPTRLAVACVAEDAGSALLLVRVDGSVLRRYPVDAPVVDDPAFSPDGRRIAYWAGAMDPLDGGSLFVTSVDGGTPRQLTDVAAGSDADPAWSPDGSRLVFRRRLPDGTVNGNLDLFTLAPDGTGVPRKLTSTRADEQDPSWSPDGKQVAFKSNRVFADGSVEGPVTRTWLITVKTPDEARLLWTRPGGDQETAPAWTRR